MEPAVDGREHVFGGVLLSVVSDPPQWSPPLMGGSTVALAVEVGLVGVPQ
jgi:hypothetical protein